jgi:hypothetical protein
MHLARQELVHFNMVSLLSVIKVSCMDAYTIRVPSAGSGS